MQKVNLKKGNILTLAILVFTMASLVLSLGVVSPIVKHIKNVRGSIYSKQAFYTGESLQEDILYRLKKNIIVSSAETMSIGDSLASASVTGVDEKNITITSDSNNFNRKISAKIVQGEGSSFSYGVQAGLGGFSIANGAVVNGNVYANGDIYGGGSVTGTAISATVPNPTAEQINIGDLLPTNEINFGGNSTPRDVAQGFKVSTTTSVSSVHLYVKKSSTNSLNDAVIKIVNDSNGKPGKNVIASVALNSSQVGTSYSYIELPFPSTFKLSQATQYWLVIYSQTSVPYEHYSIGATNSTYSNGKAMVGSWSPADGGAWNDSTPTGLDIYFGLYVNGKIGTISGVSVGTGVVGDAWANTISGSSVAGTKYCKVGTGCNTTREDPTAQAYPISNGNITDWKATAEEGGIIQGNQDIESATTLGPKKIIGDLNVKNTLNLSGTLWVTGNFVVDNKANVKLFSGYGSNSGIIIVDGKIILGNGATFSGSGVATSSYVMTISTYSSPGGDDDFAIDTENHVGAVILNAQNGIIHFKNHASAKAVTGRKIIMDPESSIIYDSGLIDINFSSGPSGAWSIDSWQEFI